MLGNCILNILELNGKSGLERKKESIETLSSYGHVVHSSAKQIISRDETWTGTTVKCTEMKIARVKRAK